MNALNWKQIEHFVPYLEETEEAVEDVCGVLILWAMMKEEGVREGGRELWWARHYMGCVTRKGP